MKDYKSKYRFGGLRQTALERDSYQCVDCGMNNEQHIVIFGRSLTVDHIDGNGRNSENPNNNLNNLQTLCLRCHGKKDIKKRRPYDQIPLKSRQKMQANFHWKKKEVKQ